MINFIKNKTPFLLLFFSAVFTVCSYFEFYISAFQYLGDITGYSIVTNLFMYSYYMNKRYCTETKVAVLGLFSLNICNLIQMFFNLNLVIYDAFIIIITFIILLFYKYRT